MITSAIINECPQQRQTTARFYVFFASFTVTIIVRYMAHGRGKKIRKKQTNFDSYSKKLKLYKYDVSFCIKSGQQEEISDSLAIQSIKTRTKYLVFF